MAKKSFFSKPRFRKSAMSGKSTRKIAIQNKKSLKRIKKIVKGVEKKYTDTGTVTAVVGTAGDIVALGRVAEGTSQATRTGNKMTMVSVFVRATAIKHASSVDQTLRMIIFVDKQQEADTKTSVTTVLQTSSTYSPLNAGFAVMRFKILRDRLFRLNSSSKSTIGFKSFIKLNLVQWYNGIAVNDIQKNGLYMLLLGSDNTNKANLVYNIRMRYYDL